MWNDHDSWARVMGVVLIAFSIGDVAVFFFEFKEHGWSRAAKIEVAVLALFVLLGLGDWHLQTLASARDKEQADKISLLDKQAAGRSLSEDQIRSIAAALKKTGLPGTVELKWPGNDHEAEAYANSFAQALHDAGWKIRGTDEINDPLPPGVLVLVHDPQLAPPNADALVNALREGNVDFQGTHRDSIPLGEVWLHVGHRPITTPPASGASPPGR